MSLTVGTNCGFVTVVPTADPALDGTQMDQYAWSNRYTSPADTNEVTQIGVHINNNAGSSPDWEVGIYSHDAGNDKPNILLGSAGPVALTASANTWDDQTVSISLSGSTTYWLAYQCDNDGAGNSDVDRDATQTSHKRDYISGATTLPAPWGTSTGTLDGVSAVYALYTAAVTGEDNLFMRSMMGVGL